MIRKITSFGTFQQFNAFNRFTVLFELYNPHINYSWSQTLTVSGNQQIKDTGTAGLNLQQYFGQGVWFNGIDQEISFETTAAFNNIGSIMVTFRTSSLLKNVYIFSNRISSNRLYLNITSSEFRLGLGAGYIVIPFILQVNTVYKVLINFNNGEYKFIINDTTFKGTYSGVVDERLFTLNNTLKYTRYTDTYLYKDLYMFNKQLTQTEIDKYNNQPNQFFMDSLADNSCLLAMPMCEKDGFVRNYKSYSEGNNLIFDSNFTNASNWVIGDNTKISIANNRATFNNATSFIYPTPFLSIFNTPSTVGKYFLCYFEVANYVSGSIRVEIGMSVSGDNTTPYINANGKYLFIVQHTTNSTNRPVLRASPFTGSVTNFQVKELSGIYPISNYLTTCRTNAQRLTYGLQTSGFKRDTNGMILSKSNFLEVDAVGYSNTGWRPDVTKPLTFECILQKNTNLFGIGTPDAATARFSVGVAGVYGSPRVLLGNSIKIYSDVVREVIYFAITLTGVAGESRLYLDGIDKGLIGETALHTPIGNFLIGVRGGLYEPSVARLFKVHQKVLTQDEVTKNFNTYDAMGLLSESGEPPVPNNAITDANGNYFVDSNGNYFVVNN